MSYYCGKWIQHILLGQIKLICPTKGTTVTKWLWGKEHIFFFYLHFSEQTPETCLGNELGMRTSSQPWASHTEPLKEAQPITGSKGAGHRKKTTLNVQGTILQYSCQLFQVRPGSPHPPTKANPKNLECQEFEVTRVCRMGLLLKVGLGHKQLRLYVACGPHSANS